MTNTKRPSLTIIRNEIKIHKYYALLEVIDLVHDYNSIIHIANAILDNEEHKQLFKDCIDWKFNQPNPYFSKEE